MANKNTTFSYIKNVGKSFGYAFVDVMKTNNPVLTSLAREAKETTSSIYQTVKDFKLGASENEKSLLDDSKDAAKSLWKNLKDDLKTGNWYNKERSKQADEALMKAMGMDFSDFDMDFSFDDDDWGDDVTSGEAKQLGQDVKNTAANIIAMEDTGNRVASAVNAGTTASANYIVQSSKQMNLALYDLNKRGFNQVTEALMAVNTTTAKFADAIGKPLTTHINNSQIFFTNVTQSLSNIEKHLAQIEKNTTGAPLAANNKYGRANGLGSIITGDGINMSAYKDMLKKNLGMYKDLFGMVSQGVKNTGGLNALAKTVSPMQFALTNLITLLIPATIKSSMEQLNSSVSSLLSGMLSKGHGLTGIWGMIADIFLPSGGKLDKRNISTNKYNKGAVAWDGIARKALIEVIPTTLFKIYSAITGTDEMSYNYETGKFVTIKSIRKDVANRELRAAQSAGGQFRDDLREDAAATEKVKRELDAYFLRAFIEGNPNKMEGMDAQGNRVKLSSNTIKLLQRKIHGEEKEGKKVGKSQYANKYVGELLVAQEDYSNRMYREEASGHSIDNALVNGSRNMRPTGSKFFVQDYQAKVIYYLEGIYKNTWYGGGTDGVGGGGPRGKGPVMFKSPIYRSSGAREKTKSENNKDLKKKKLSNMTQAERDSLTKEEKAALGMEELKDTVNEKKSGFKQKIVDFLENRFPGIYTIMKKPIDAFAGFVDKFSDGITEFLWGDKGIFEFVKDKFKDKFSNVKETFSGFWNDTKESLKNVGSSMGSTAKKILGIHDQPKPTPDIYQDENGKWRDRATGRFVKAPDQAYNGRQVTRTGLVAVSEGELIIPSEFNPFFRGRTNKKEQMRRENEAIRRFYGARDNGDKGVGATREQKTKSDKGSASSDDAAAPHEPFGLLDYLKTFFSNTKDSVIKAKNKVIESEFNQKLSESMNKVGLKEARGNMGAGFLLGAVGGGIFGSPVLGALMGTTIGYITKSQAAQSFLFGDIDEATGERQGGLFGKEVSNFMTKNMPKIGKGAAMGYLGGAFFGSPVLGAVIGSTVGYVASSNAAKEILFGKDIVDENGNVTGRQEGIISSKLQAAVKKAAPNMVAGAVGGLVLGGPFGMVGNMLLGSAIGYATSTTKFHDYFFGDGTEENRGLLHKIQDKILGNLTEIFANLGNSLARTGKHILNSSVNLIKGIFHKVGSWFEDAESGKKGLLGRLIGWTGRRVSNVVSAVGAPLKGIATGLKRRNLRTGADVFDKREGRNLTAQERINLRATMKGRVGSNDLDQALANIKDQQQLKELQDLMAGARRGDETALSQLQEWSTQNNVNLFSKKGKLKENRLIDAQKLLKTESSRFDPQTSIRNNVAKITRFLCGIDDEGNKASERDVNKDAAAKVNDAAQDLSKNNATKTIPGPGGLPIEITEDGDPDMRDKETAKIIKDSEEATEAQKSMPEKIDNMTNTVGGFFGKLGNTLFGTKDEPTLLGKAINFIKDHFLLIIAGIAAVKSFLSGKLGDVISTAVSGVNKAAKALTNGAYGDKEKEGVLVPTEEGRETYVDDQGITRYKDTGEIAKLTVERQGPDSLFTRAMKSLIQAPFRQGAKETVKNGIKNAAKGLAEKAENALLKTKAIDGIVKFFRKVFKKEMTEEVAESAAKEVVEAAEKKAGAKALAKSLAKVAGVILVVGFAVADFTTGYQDARNTLRITAEPTTSQKILCGLVRALKNFIPLFGTLIPDAVVMDILAPIFGAIGIIDYDELKKQRAAGEAEKDAYNSEHGTNYNLQEYNKKVLHAYTWTERIGMQFKSLTNAEARNQVKAMDIEKRFKNLTGYDPNPGAKHGTGSGGRISQEEYIGETLYNKYWDAYYEIAMNSTDRTHSDQREIEKLIKADKKALKKGQEIDETKYSRTLYKSENNGALDGRFNGTGRYSGGASGIISQYDPRYSGMSIGGSSFASKGCGPAVAAMVAQALGRNLSVQDAVSMSKPYQNSNGVSADYFTNVLGSRGIRTSYSTDPNQMARNIAGGGNTILLGSDPTNTSKDRSPFGPGSHYVLATGTDGHGNIIVKDPESGIRAYSPNILKSAQLGIYTGGTSGILPDTDISRRVWSFFKSQGFSDAATAGIMGNLYQESGMKPEIVQKGSGHAAGIAQWESYKNKSGRWLNMANYAASRGRDWTDLDSQLNFLLQELSAKGMQKRISGEAAPSNIDKMNAISGWNIPYGITYDQFKNTDDLRVSTGLFEAAFERAGKPNMQGRYNNALDYFNKYSSGQYNKVYEDANPANLVAASNRTGGETNEDEEPTTIGNILSKIMNAFSTGFGILTGNKNNTSSSTTTASNDGTGITANPTGFDFTGAKQPIDYMKAIERKIDYSMKGPRDPDKGSADCSSTVRWAIQKAGGPNIGGNTSAQYNSPYLDTVWYNNANYMPSIPSTMKPNDIIFFQRPNGDWAQSHPDKVGHVGLYLGNGEYIHHPGGKGPKIEKLPVGNKGQILKVSRVKASGSGSGLKPAKFIGGASAINNLRNQSTAMLNDMASNVRVAGSNGSITPELAQQLLMAIIEILKSIANNTAPVGQIYQTLTTLNTQRANIAAKAETDKAKSNEDINDSFKNVVSQLSAIAKG